MWKKNPQVSEVNLKGVGGDAYGQFLFIFRIYFYADVNIFCFYPDIFPFQNPVHISHIALFKVSFSFLELQ